MGGQTNCISESVQIEAPALRSFIVINLAWGEGSSRWALYELTNRGSLEVLWGDTSGDKPKTLYPNQVISNRKGLPYFHFLVRGYGHNHLHSLASNLVHHFRGRVELIELSGHQPSITRVGEGW